MLPGWRPAHVPDTEGYAFAETASQGHRYVIVAGGDARGTLYGAFALLAQVAQVRTLSRAAITPST